VTAAVESEFAEHARRYSRLGWALIRTNGKRPHGRAWEQTAPAEPEFTAGQWNQWGERFNMGAVLGPSGLAVFEYDDPNAEPRFLELLGGEIPQTPICRTGSGKFHAYFADPCGLTKQARDGLELRVGNHQCVVPPSAHPATGQPYAWVPGHEPWTMPLLPVPQRVLDFFQAEAGQRRNGSAPAVADVIRIGQIDQTLASLAGTMRRRGMSAEAITAALVAELDRCEPGHTHTEADCRRIARSVARYEPADADPLPTAVEEPPFELVVVTARDLCGQPDLPREGELLGPLLVRGYRTVIGAHTGEGKTTMALAWAAAVANGQPWLDWTGVGGVRVLILDAEQGAKTLKRRLREAGLDSSGQVDVIRVPDGLALDRNERHVAALERVFEQGDYALVIADPLYKLHEGASNDDGEAKGLMRLFDRWREQFNFAFVPPTHCRKPVPGMKFSIHDLFGSSAYVRGAEVVIGLQRLAPGLSRLHFLKDRDGDLPLAERWGLLFSREDGYRRDPKDGEPKENASDKVREALEVEPGLTQEQLKRRTGYAERTIRGALKTLGATGDNRKPERWRLPLRSLLDEGGDA
jgi:hypothetical protein